MQDKAQASSNSADKENSDEYDEKPADSKVSPGSKRPSAANAGGKRGRGGKKKKKNKSGGEDQEKEAVGGQRPKNTKRRSVASKVSYKEESSEGEGPSEEEEFELSSEDESDDSGPKSSKRRSKTKGKGTVRAPRRSSGVNKAAKKEEEDEEEQEENKGRRRQRAGKGDDEWIEVYLEGGMKWVCVDVDQGIGKPQLCAGQATQPITYVVGVDSEGYLKDLSTRYDSTWLTSSRRRRIDSEWWEETLECYECPVSEREKKEDKEVKTSALQNT